MVVDVLVIPAHSIACFLPLWFSSWLEWIIPSAKAAHSPSSFLPTGTHSYTKVIFTFQDPSTSTSWPSATRAFRTPVRMTAHVTTTQWIFTGAHALMDLRYWPDPLKILQNVKSFLFIMLKSEFHGQGQDCDVPIHACITNPCKNGGTCHLKEGEVNNFWWVVFFPV